MGWDANKTVQQHGQHGEYNLSRLGDDKTRVRFTITVEPWAPLPEFWVARARKKILDAALEGLRKRVMGVAGEPGSSAFQRGQSLDRLVKGDVAFAESEAHQVVPHMR